MEYVPLRDVAESMGYSVIYNPTYRLVGVYDNSSHMIATFMDNDSRGTYIDSYDNKMYVWIDENTDNKIILGIPNKESGYVPPKGGRHWDKERKGWKNAYGNVWIKDKTAHGGAHWDVQYPNGGYDNVYEDGTVREGKGGRGRFSPISVNVHSSEV